ncbi:hypothetical protein IJ118_00345 [Candidatus Saccharibacteria bacterium]|nr:hypothetical protein [Candidatus Saccharibacteria bacterium]
MANTLKKRGQKFVKRFSRTSLKVSEESKEHLKENLLQRFSHIRNIRLLIFEWSLLVLALIMLSVTQAFWFGDSYADNTFVAGGSYIEATLGRVNSLNPLFATTSSEKVLSRLMFATLVANDYSGNPGVALAQSIRSNEDGKVWTLKLRDGLKWSDGRPITNEDIMFTLDLIQSPAVNSIYDSNLENVKISESENGEIIFTLPTAYADFASALEIPIVPKHELDDAELKTLVEDSFSNAPVTSGAFSFNATQTTTVSDEAIFYLSGNPYYYDGTPMLTSFGVHTYLDKSEIVSALRTGNVTATAELASIETGQINSGSFEMTNASINVGAFAFFNTSTGTFRDTALRRAVKQGLDLAQLRAAAPETKPLDYPLLDSQIALSQYPTPIGYDQAAAKSKIAEISGNNRPAISIVTVNSGFLPAVATNLKSQLENLGFDCNMTAYDETQDFVANVLSRRAYDILVYKIDLGADPDLLPYYHSSQASGGGLNLSNYRNVLVDDLLIGARATLDPTLRARKYESFLEHWVADVPAIGLYQANMLYIYNKNVRTFSPDVHLVTELDRFVDVVNWAAARGTKNLTP